MSSFKLKPSVKREYPELEESLIRPNAVIWATEQIKKEEKEWKKIIWIGLQDFY